jgi:H+/gluconate symporter-like permease
VIAAAIAAVFVVFALLMYRRVMPAILALPLMAVIMALVAGVPFAALGTIVVGGASDLSQVYVAVIFGALLGRVTMDTGIARAMVNLAAEYGGENPFALALVLCAIVAVLFTSLSGLGAIIMVGSIVLPIMMTVGVPRTVAATLFLMSFALGFIFNIANWTFYTKYFNVEQGQMVRYAVVLAVIDAIALLVYAIVAFRREREYATWAVRAESDEPSRVPAIALLTPVLPIVLYYLLKMPATPAFALSAVFGVLVTRPRESVQTLVAAAIRGVEDVAPAVLLFMGIGMLLVATQQPQFAAALAPLAGAWIANPTLFVLVFGVASPLALYRGPLNPFGVGIAIFTVLLAANVVPPVVLVAAIMAVVQVQNVCDPTNTANVWIANFTGVHIDTITRRTLPFQVGVAILATLAIVLASPQLFGAAPFRWSLPAARAADLDGGFFAAPNASGRVGIGDDGTPFGAAAADTVGQQLELHGLRAPSVSGDANDGDCSRKPYAAFVYVTVSQFALIEGDDIDVGLRLEDCGGWIVQEWHDHGIAAPQQGGSGLVRELALEGAARLNEWRERDRAHSEALFARGVSFAPGDAPTYFLSLFKTVDGNMRAYVRGGGPAYVAGLRSGDVVSKIDGKFWWEYGTFQTQLRAYDGKPHSFEILRGSQTINVQLGAPFVPSTGGA